MPDLIGILGGIFIAGGLAFDVLGCMGLVRMPDIYNRLQAATKCVTIGTCSILFGVALLAGPGATGLKCLLAIVFILLTAPVAAHAIARGAHHAGVALAPESLQDSYADDQARGGPAPETAPYAPED